MGQKPVIGREPVTIATTTAVRIWRSDADWVRRQAFERRIPQAMIVAEALERLRNASDVDGSAFDRVG